MENKENKYNSKELKNELSLGPREGKFRFSMQNPFVFAFFLTSILLILILLAAILRMFFTINVPSMSPPIIQFVLIIALGLIYRQKYKEKLPKDLMYKTALYSSVLVMLLILIFSFFCILYKLKSGIIFFTLLAIVGFFANFAFIFFGLRLSNSICLGNIKLPKQREFILQQDEKIILKPKRMTVKCFIAYLIIFIPLVFYMYFIGIKIFISLGIFSEVLSIGIFIGLIIETIERFFISDFILTNKRIIIKRYFIYNEILLKEIESLSSHQVFDYGTLAILSKNGCAFKSATIANPNDVKAEIDKYIQSSSNNKE